MEREMWFLFIRMLPLYKDAVNDSVFLALSYCLMRPFSLQEFIKGPKLCFSKYFAQVQRITLWGIFEFPNIMKFMDICSFILKRPRIPQKKVKELEFWNSSRVFETFRWLGFKVLLKKYNICKCYEINDHILSKKKNPNTSNSC